MTPLLTRYNIINPVSNDLQNELFPIWICVKKDSCFYKTRHQINKKQSLFFISRYDQMLRGTNTWLVNHCWWWFVSSNGLYSSNFHPLGFQYITLEKKSSVFIKFSWSKFDQNEMKNKFFFHMYSYKKSPSFTRFHCSFFIWFIWIYERQQFVKSNNQMNEIGKCTESDPNWFFIIIYFVITQEVSNKLETVPVDY